MSDSMQKPWLPASPPPKLYFKNASLVDVEYCTVHPNTSIETSNGLITYVSSGPAREPSQDAQVIDLTSRYVCPGLIDCHVHMSATPGSLSLRDLFAAHPNTITYRTTFVVKQMLLRGFTTARDTGGADAALRTAIAEGLLPGPRLFIAGQALSQTGGHGDFRPSYQESLPQCCGGAHQHQQPSLARVCDGVPACLVAARDELRHGADFLKIMCGGGVVTPSDPLDMLQFSGDEIQAITATAASRHTYVTAHAYTAEAIRHAIDNGVRGIEHANFIDRATAELCAARGVVVTPTLVTYASMARPPFDGFLDEAGRAKNQEVLDAGLRALRICADAGVTLAFGSDLLAGMHAWQNGEFALRAEVLSAAEVLRSATVNAARVVGMEGAIADMLVLDGDPLQDITVLDRVESTLLGILKDGRAVASKVEGLTRDALYDGMVL